MKALILDTETTGLIDNRTIALDKQPYIIEYFGNLADLATGEVIETFHSLVKPPIPLPLNVKGTKGIADMTGITEQMLVGQPTFAQVADKIAKQIQSAPVAIAHNMGFDKDMIDVEFERLGRKLSWGRCMCTVEQTVQLCGCRLNLTKLFSILFPGETFVAHRAGNDVLALTRVCVELYKRDLL